MPWNARTLSGISAGLRESAAAGHFEPYYWVASTVNDSLSCSIRGCGWGLVGWYAGIMTMGLEWTKRYLPEGSTQEEVNDILRLAGLTHEEIDSMDPPTAWEHFDEQLALPHLNRDQRRLTFISQSKVLAEYFIDILNRVPVDEGCDIWSEPTPLQLLYSDDDWCMDDGIPVLTDVVESVDETEPAVVAA